MVEDLDDLLALDHLLDIAIDFAHGLLLSREILAAPAAHGLHHRQHHRQRAKGDEGQYGTEHQHHGDGAQEVQRAGDDAGEAVVQGLGHCLDVVGVATHQLAVGVGVKVFQGQSLHFVEQVRPDLRDGVLGHMDHNAGISEGADRAHDVDQRHEAQHFGEARKIARQDIVVNEGLDEVGAAHGAGRADEQQDHDQCQVGLVPAQIAHELAQGAPHIFGLAEPALGGMAGSVGAGRRHTGTGMFLFSHGCSLLPAGTGRPRGKCRRSSSIPRGCPGPLPGPGPSPGSGPRPSRRSPAGQ